MDGLLHITLQFAIFVATVCISVVILSVCTYVVIFFIKEIYDISKPYIDYIKSRKGHGE